MFVVFFQDFKYENSNKNELREKINLYVLIFLIDWLNVFFILKRQIF